MSADRRMVRARECLDATAPYPDPAWHAMDDLYRYAEERLRVNVGLVMENAELRKRLRDGVTTVAGSVTGGSPAPSDNYRTDMT